MKVMLEISNQKAAFFFELLESLSDFVSVEAATELPTEKEIPIWHKNLLDERLKRLKTNPDGLLDWDEVQADLLKLN